MLPLLSRLGQFINIFQTTTTAGESVPVVQLTTFDIVMNALLRLIRPVILFGFGYLFWLAWKYPVDFKTFGLALKELPEFMALGFLLVLSSVAVPKMIQGSRAPSVRTEVTVETGSAKPPAGDLDTSSAANPTLEALKGGSAKPPVEDDK